MYTLCTGSSAGSLILWSCWVSLTSELCWVSFTLGSLHRRRHLAQQSCTAQRHSLCTAQHTVQHSTLCTTLTKSSESLSLQNWAKWTKICPNLTKSSESLSLRGAQIQPNMSSLNSRERSGGFDGTPRSVFCASTVTVGLFSTKNQKKSKN